MLAKAKGLVTRFRRYSITPLTIISGLIASLLFIIAISKTDLLEDQQHVSHSSIFHPKQRVMRNVHYRILEEPPTEWTKLHASDIDGPMFDDFCHPPGKPVLGLEGFVPDGFELQQSHILVTPGEVTPREQVTYRPSVVFCSNSTDLIPDVAIKENKFAEKEWKFMHKDFSHLQTLSMVGKQRLGELGQFLRSVYFNELKVENQWWISRHIKVYTTGKYLSEESSAVLMESLLAGVFSQKTYTAPLTPNLCSSRWSQVNCHCPSLSTAEMRIKNIFYEGELLWKGDNSTLKSGFLHQIMSNLCSNPGNECYMFNKSTNLHLFKDLIKEMNDNYGKLMKNEDFINFVHIYLFPFLQNLVNVVHHVEHVFEKFFMYFVDRELLFYLLNVFRYPVKSLPRPGSRVVLELYKKSGQSFQPYYVRVLFNGADISTFIPLCNVKMERGLCRLKGFANLLSWKVRGQDLNNAYHNFCSS